MALYGPICVTMTNDDAKVIGTWSAQRLDDLISNEQVSRYKCKVAFTDERGDMEFEVEHKYSDGAGVLMARVFSKYEEVMDV